MIKTVRSDQLFEKKIRRKEAAPSKTKQQNDKGRVSLTIFTILLWNKTFNVICIIKKINLHIIKFKKNTSSLVSVSIFTTNLISSSKYCITFVLWTFVKNINVKNIIIARINFLKVALMSNLSQGSKDCVLIGKKILSVKVVNKKCTDLIKKLLLEVLILEITNWLLAKTTNSNQQRPKKKLIWSHKTYDLRINSTKNETDQIWIKNETKAFTNLNKINNDWKKKKFVHNVVQFQEKQSQTTHCVKWKFSIT